MSQSELTKLRKEVAKLKLQLAGKQPVTTEEPGPIHRFLANPYFQAVAVFIALGVAFSGKLDAYGTAIAVGCAFLIGAIGIYVRCSKTSSQKVLAAVLVVVWGGLMWSFNGYLLAKGGPLTIQQRSDFTAILKSILVPPEYTEIDCPSVDEAACIYAATFIPLFQRAGWKVQGPEVKRVVAGHPTSNVQIGITGPPLVNPQDPDQGVWTQYGIWHQILKTAFEFVNIHPEQLNDPTLPRTMVRVYFGSVAKK